MALKIIHTADWHLGQTFYEYEREAEHDAFMRWLIEFITKEEIDILLISGDVFDVSNPSSAAQRMFYRFLRDVNITNPKMHIIIIAGNHDSAARLEAPNPLMEVMNTVVVGTIRRDENRKIDYASLVTPMLNRKGECEGWCMTVPYLRQGDYPTGEDTQDDYSAGVARMYEAVMNFLADRVLPTEAIVAMGHLYATGAELSENDRTERVLKGGLESLPVEAFDEKIVYTALGHIHKAQRVGGRDNVRYAGSPLPMSFSEKNYNHQVIYLKINEGKLISCESVSIPLHCPVVSIPADPLLVDEVLETLSGLPSKQDDDDKTKYPYLEVKVLVDGPNPSLRSRIEEVLTDKAVRLACISPTSATKNKEDYEDKIEYEEFKQLNPLEMLNIIYEKKYNSAMPESIGKLFNQVMRDIQL